MRTKGRDLRVVHFQYGLKLGGLERVVLNLAEGGQAHGIIPHIAAFGIDGPIRELCTRRGIEFEYFDGINGLTPQMFWRLSQAVRKWNADLVHAHDIGPWLNAAAAHLLTPKTPLIATFHQLLQPTGLKRIAATAAASVSKVLIACGDEVRGDLDRWVPSYTRKVTINNGVQIPPPISKTRREEARKRLGLPLEATVIGYLGRIHWEKGLDRLIEAFLSVFRDNPRIHLVLVGWGLAENEIRQLIERERADNVHMPGEFTEGAAALLAAFDIYAQASKREGRSLSLMEAMAAGLPTVANHLPAVAELHEQKKTALLVPPGDGVAFAGALKLLVENPDLRRTMGVAARDRAMRFSLDSMLDEYFRLYQQVLHEPDPTVKNDFWPVRG